VVGEHRAGGHRRHNPPSSTTPSWQPHRAFDVSLALRARPLWRELPLHLMWRCIATERDMAKSRRSRALPPGKGPQVESGGVVFRADRRTAVAIKLINRGNSPDQESCGRRFAGRWAA
jgi:hypothetical protein